jgi:hypothetical protein
VDARETLAGTFTDRASVGRVAIADATTRNDATGINRKGLTLTARHAISATEELRDGTRASTAGS